MASDEGNTQSLVTFGDRVHWFYVCHYFLVGLSHAQNHVLARSDHHAFYEGLSSESQWRFFLIFCGNHVSPLVFFSTAFWRNVWLSFLWVTQGWFKSHVADALFLVSKSVWSNLLGRFHYISGNIPCLKERWHGMLQCKTTETKGV